MDEKLIIQTVIGTGGFGALAILIRIVFVQWMKQNPGLQQAAAANDIYIMIRKEMKAMKKELKILKKQVVLLEHLCLEKGLDVHTLYKDAGIFEDQEEEGDE